MSFFLFVFQAEDGIRDLVRSRGLGDVYKRQGDALGVMPDNADVFQIRGRIRCRGNLVPAREADIVEPGRHPCLLYTSDAADERSSVDLGGRRIIKKKK